MCKNRWKYSIKYIPNIKSTLELLLFRRAKRRNSYIFKVKWKIKSIFVSHPVPVQVLGRFGNLKTGGAFLRESRNRSKSVHLFDFFHFTAQLCVFIPVYYMIMFWSRSYLVTCLNHVTKSRPFIWSRDLVTSLDHEVWSRRRSIYSTISHNLSHGHEVWSHGRSIYSKIPHNLCQCHEVWSRGRSKYFLHRFVCSWF